MRKKTMIAVLTAAMVLSGCAGSTSTAEYSGSATASETAGARMATMDSMAAYDSYDVDDSYAVNETEYTSEGPLDSSGSGSTIADVDTSQKIVRNMSYTVETTDMDALVDALKAKLVELDGYVETSQISGGNDRYDGGYYLDSEGVTRYDDSYTPSYAGNLNYKYATYTIRIPADKLDEFACELESESNVTSQSTTTEDITSTYVDTDSRRKSLEEEMETLEAMAKKAETVDEMIQIQSQISNVRYELENIQSQLKSMDNRVAYSTVELDITEVTVLSNTSSAATSWTERIANGFKTSCETVVYTIQEDFIYFVSNLPMILFQVAEFIALVLVALGVFKLVRMIIRKKRDKKIASIASACKGEDAVVAEDTTEAEAKKE